MKIPAKLLPDGVDEDGVFVFRKFVDPFRPERNGEADEQDRLDQDDGKFQVSRDAARDAFVIRHRIAAFPKTPEDKNEKGRPPDEKRAHEPMENSMM